MVRDAACVALDGLLGMRREISRSRGAAIGKIFGTVV